MAELPNNVLSETDLRYAVEHLNENDRERHIADIKTWLQSQPTLNARSDDVSVLRFLRACKFDLEETRTKMVNYYKMRADSPEWFFNRDPNLPEIQELLDIGVFLPLRHQDMYGRMVCLIRASAHNPRKHSQNNVFKTGKMVLDIAMEQNEISSIYGIVAVFDLINVTVGHATQLTPRLIQKAVHSWQNCYPVRVKRLDFINAPFYVNVVLNVFRRFLSDKLKKRIYIHSGNLDSLHKIISPDILPCEYGGSSGCIADLQGYWKEQVMANRVWLLEDEIHKADVAMLK